MKIKEFEYLMDSLKSLPTISSKSAERIAHFWIKSDDKYYSEFIERLIQARMKIKLCKYCNNYTIDSFICDICENKERRNKNLCIVSEIGDLDKIESSNSFFGTYFIIQGEINYKKKESINLIDSKQLFNLIDEFKIEEVLMATNMTINGEVTANYLKKLIQEYNKNISCYRLAMGLPVNSSIDYIDWESLKFSIKNKTKM